jgi:hypothetical protein
MAAGHYNGIRYFDTLVLATHMRTLFQSAADLPRYSRKYRGGRRYQHCAESDAGSHSVATLQHLTAKVISALL